MKITKDLIKIFADWTKLKIRIHVSENDLIFHEREVWWASIGQNIGVESNGKNKDYERPVIILKRFNRKSFIGVVLSSIEKRGKYYFELKDENGISSFANLSQIRLMSSKRLIRNVRKLPKEDFDTIKDSVKQYL